MTLELKHKKHTLFHLIAWLILIFILSNYAFFQTGELAANVFYRIAYAMAIFYLNYSFLVPRLLLNNKKLVYFFCVMLTIACSKYLIETLFPNFAPISSVNRTAALVFFPIINIVLGTAIRIYQQWSIDEKNKKKIEEQKNLTELQVLKNQLNPHFLFNSLNSIYSLSFKKSDDAPEAILTLSELMRYMIYKANNDFVLLREDIEYIKNFIALQRMRLIKKAKINLSIKGNINDQKIRPLLFISYIENAFKHGVDIEGKTDISIDIDIKEEELEFNCTNLIGAKPIEKEGKGVGMKNTLEQLKILYPNRHKLQTFEKNNNFTVNLKLKLD